MMKKILFYSVIACVIMMFPSCSDTCVDKMHQALEDGTLYVGCTYDEVVAVLGEPETIMDRGDEMEAIYVTYKTVDYRKMTCAFVYKEIDGVNRVTMFLSDTDQTGIYDLKKRRENKNQE